METVTIQIGNSDNKLTQAKWAELIRDVRLVLGNHCGQIHFDGGSRFDSQWQNACFVAEIYEIDKKGLLESLSRWAILYNQDSIAVTFGTTEFI